MPIYKTMECDVLVIGGGVAGLGAAIKASNLSERVILVDKSKVARSGSSPFVNYMWLVKLPEENTETYLTEIIERGEYLSDQEWVKTYLEKIHPLSVELEQWGEEFGKKIFKIDAKGNYIRRQLAGNIKTWAAVYDPINALDALRMKAEQKGVTFVERVMLTDLMVSSRGVVGAIGFNYRTGDIYLFKAKAVVTAAGMHNFGKQTVSALTLNGELTSAAYRAGATLYKLEMTHSVPKPKDYASEDLMRWVLNGGAHYVNEIGKEFLSDYVPKGLPARLQDLSIAFANEARETGGTYADVSQATPQDRHFLEGILSPDDLAKGMITWVPALSGGGGVHINACCKTSLSGLYAAGDNGGRPVIGSYNVNGIMISYAYVSGCFAGENAAGYANGIKGPHWYGTSIDKQVDQTIKNLTVCLDKSRGLRPGQIIHAIQEIIIPLQVTLIRNEKRLKNALNEIQRIKEKNIPTMKAIDLHDLAKAQSALSLVLLAELTLRSALFREESRGFHYREDYPYTDNHNWLKNVMVKLEDGSPLVWAEDVPTPYLSPSVSTATPPGAKRTWGGSA